MQNTLDKLNYLSREKQWKELIEFVNSLSLYNDREHLQIYFKKANALRELKQYNKALQEYEQITNLYPRNPWAYFSKVELLALTGKRDEAKRLSEKYFQEFAKDKNVISFYKKRIACFFMTYEKIGVAKDWLSFIFRKNVFYNIPKEEQLRIIPPQYNSDYYMYSTSNNSFKRPKTTVSMYKNVYLSIDITRQHKIEYYLFNEKKQQILNLSNGDHPFLLSDSHIINEPVVFIDDKFTKFNICHFLLDKLTRIEEMEKINDSSYLLLAQNTYTDVIADLLNINFVDFMQHVECTLEKRVTLKINKFYMSNSSTYMFHHPGQNMHPNSLKMLERIRSKFVLTPKKYKIFIDRSQARTRRILNNDEVKTYLISKGFIIAQLENMSVEEQLSLFRNAECVVATHGAGLTNVAMCEPGTKVIEILPPFYATPAFWKLARALHLDYDTVLATDAELPSVKNYRFWQHDGKMGNRDIVVPLDKLAELIVE